MNLEDYIACKESKYAVIRWDSFLQDEVAQSITTSPRTFVYQGIDMAVLSLDPKSVKSLSQYATQAANGVEFEITIGSGKVTLLTHSQMIYLINEHANKDE